MYSVLTRCSRVARTTSIRASATGARRDQIRPPVIQARCIYYNPGKTAERQRQKVEKLQALHADMNESLLKVHGLTEVLVLDEEGKNRGIFKIQDALVLAKQRKLDLILVNKNATPAVTKLAKSTRFVQETVTGVKEKDKEIIIGEAISENDLQIKVTRIRLLLEKLHKVKVLFKYKTLRNVNKELCKAILGNILSRVSDIADTTKSTMGLDSIRDHHLIIWPDTKAIKKRQKSGVKELTRKEIEIEEMVAKLQKLDKIAEEKAAEEKAQKEEQREIELEEQQQEAKKRTMEKRRELESEETAKKVASKPAPKEKKVVVEEEEEEDEMYDDDDEEEEEDEEEEYDSQWLLQQAQKGKKNQPSKAQAQQQKLEQEKAQREKEKAQKEEEEKQRARELEREKREKERQQLEEKKAKAEAAKSAKSATASKMDPSQFFLDDEERLSSGYGEGEEEEDYWGEEEEEEDYDDWLKSMQKAKKNPPKQDLEENHGLTQKQLHQQRRQKELEWKQEQNRLQKELLKKQIQKQNKRRDPEEDIDDAEEIFQQMSKKRKNF
eukprot:TRINITY_DN4294_c0_g1_i1.p1 TRINITY_DN4294_c0_g1~~TRINITY_DN4294_c0_g1_i1.p1  ORF type:complete len:552 (-),score=222.73 TRINITY_DN4294_c0_g1_i1:61-1716(-)